MAAPGFAVAVVAALAARVVRVRARRDDDDGAGEAAGRRRLAQGRRGRAGLDAEEQVDQVLLLGFDGTDASAPIVAELASASSAACSSDRQNGASPGLVTAIATAGRPAAGSRR